MTSQSDDTRVIDSIVDSDEKEPGFFERFSKTPCMRQSFLTGISSGLGVGLLTFLRTSDARKSSNFAVGGYAIVTLGTWIYCRYKFTEKQFLQKQIKQGIQNKLQYEGTDLAPESTKDS